MSNKKDFERKLLDRMHKRFIEQKIPAVVRDAKQENIPTDILTALHSRFGAHLDEVLGECYFLPMPQANPDEGVYYFTSVITLSEELAPVNLSEVIRAVTFLNFYLPCGSFIINPPGNLLAFKIVTPIPDNIPEDLILDIMDLNIAHSLDLSERYINHLLSVAEGQLTAEQFAGSFM